MILADVNYDSVIFIAIAFIVIFGLILPFITCISSKFTFGKPDLSNGNEISLDSKNQIALKRAVTKENKVIVLKQNNVTNAEIDVITFKGNKKKRHSFKVLFNNDTATLDVGESFDSVAVVVVKANNKNVHGKRRGYANFALIFSSSIGLFVAVAGALMISAAIFSEALYDYFPEFAICYIVPIIIGAVIGVLHFILVAILTRRNKFGGAQ